MTKPRYPSLFQLNTQVRLSELSRQLGRPATLDDLEDAEFDGKTYRLVDFLTPASLDYAGDKLQAPGLYVGLHRWGFWVFELQEAR